jgi:thiol-disulfide isomerase/thioredoxin
MRVNKCLFLLAAGILSLCLAACGTIGDVLNEAQAEVPPMPEPSPTPEPPAAPELPEPAAPADTAPTFAFPFAFSTTDVYGNEVTQETLGQKEVFFVHLWATWCPPCIAEMPDLAQLVANYGDRVGFLAMLIDFDNAQGAASILESFGVPLSFLTVDALIADMRTLLEMVDSGYVPTTIIIDKDGNMIGEQIIGANIHEYVRRLDEYLG